jgi:3'5'-cyclic nucleotide phosphodiesterase
LHALSLVSSLIGRAVLTLALCHHLLLTPTARLDLAALIHDVDHQGIPNFVLVQEKSPLAAKYNNKSVAEQNSGKQQRRTMSLFGT